MKHIKKIEMAQLAVICPTMNRPEKVDRLIASLDRLSTPPAQVLIADGAHNLRRTVEKYKKNLPIQLLYCPQPGQILQRNYALSFLKKDIQLVIYADDDNTFDTDAFDKMLDFWNTHAKLAGMPLAGVSFNVVDLPPINQSKIRKLFFLSASKPGDVLKSGFAAPFSPASHQRTTSWLLGGSTAWSREILEIHIHPIHFPTKWAVCEDLMYSYALSKTHRLMIAEEAHAYHNEDDQDASLRKSIFHGYSSVVMRRYFVSQHHELKLWAFLWMTVGIIFGHLLQGLCGRQKSIGLAIGNMLGILKIVKATISGTKAKQIAEDLFYR